MISDRPHRPARSVEEARAELMQCAGTHLDPEVVEILFWAIAQNRLTSGAGGRPSIIIVDPDASFRRLMRFRLQDEGIDCILRNTADGVEALLESRPSELLIVGVDALGATPLLQLRAVASRLGLTIPVVALLDTEARDSRVGWLKRGADDVMAKNADLEEIVVRIKAILHRAVLDRAGEASPEGITGRLEAMDLPDICQFLMLGVKTARVQLRADDGREATIWVHDGAIAHATCGDRVGEAAFYDALHFSSGHFVVNHGVRADTCTIDKDPTVLLMEGAHRLDESRVAAADVQGDAGRQARPFGAEEATPAPRAARSHP
jgi:DNA-binding response OmpR family regulator